MELGVYTFAEVVDRAPSIGTQRLPDLVEEIALASRPASTHRRPARYQLVGLAADEPGLRGEGGAVPDRQCRGLHL